MNNPLSAYHIFYEVAKAGKYFQGNQPIIYQPACHQQIHPEVGRRSPYPPLFAQFQGCSADTGRATPLSAFRYRLLGNHKCRDQVGDTDPDRWRHPAYRGQHDPLQISPASLPVRLYPGTPTDQYPHPLSVLQ